MGSLSIWHWLVVGAVLLLVFGGRGKISDLMGDVAKGIKAFKKGMTDGRDGGSRAQIRRADQDHRSSGSRRDEAARRVREQGLSARRALAPIAAARQASRGRSRRPESFHVRH